MKRSICCEKLLYVITLSIGLFMFENNQLGCKVVKNDNDYIDYEFDDDIIKMKNINKHIHTAPINDACNQSAGKEENDLFNNQFICSCFAMKYPLSIGNIRE